MQRLSLVFFSSDEYDSAAVFEAEFRKLGFDVNVTRPSFLRLAPTATERLKIIRRLLDEKARESFVVYNPGTRELFFNDVDFTLTFSGYSSWFNHQKMRVIPHVWTPVQMPQDIEPLCWREKPPLRIGFMGSPYTASRITAALLKVPQSVRNWLLRGSYLRYPELVYRLRDLQIPVVNTNTFARAEVLATLRQKRSLFSDVNLEISERSGFSGLDEHLREYKHHLRNSTYVICPRGMENYSYRMYEALCFGRVPVIVDTNMVLPDEVEWDRVSIRVPYQSLNEVYDFIRNDYYSMSADDFAARQRLAFATVRNLYSMRWVESVAVEIASLARR